MMAANSSGFLPWVGIFCLACMWGSVALQNSRVLNPSKVEAINIGKYQNVM